MPFQYAAANQQHMLWLGQALRGRALSGTQYAGQKTTASHLALILVVLIQQLLNVGISSLALLCFVCGLLLHDQQEFRQVRLVDPAHFFAVISRLLLYCSSDWMHAR